MLGRPPVLDSRIANFFTGNSHPARTKGGPPRGSVRFSGEKRTKTNLASTFARPGNPEGGLFTGKTLKTVGRHPVPTSLKVLRGNPGKGPINTSEPKPPPADLTPPDGLSEHGLEVWNQTVPVLNRMGVFSQADRLTLTRYCLLSEQFQHVVKHVREHGMTQLTQTGYSQLTAEGALFKSLPAELLRIEQQFGMTPASRSSIKVDTNAAAPEDPLEAYIQSRGA